ncbi:hypothetical protein J2TS6_08570 [Paenibacillus albilobatus]|uniref:Uncharacterized protein n=1 Tax=Paenibacillus albilobatus TaxID=2716884 RepID=A0A919XCM9_9BACL|nr:hypothetical protein J2TS6_08570 [Paenibacillus albilobatus]
MSRGTPLNTSKKPIQSNLPASVTSIFGSHFKPAKNAAILRGMLIQNSQGQLKLLRIALLNVVPNVGATTTAMPTMLITLPRRF